MLEDFRLKVFITVAAEGSFTKAASVLNISQPAVSQNVSELERVTGVRLFDRLRGEVKLTEQGRVFLSQADRILADYRSLSHMFSPLDAATVRIKASDEIYAFLSGSFELFMTIHPEVAIVRSENEDFDLSFGFTRAPREMGGISATHNVISSMYLLCSPSESFAQTELFAMLRGFLADTIS